MGDRFFFLNIFAEAIVNFIAMKLIHKLFQERPVGTKTNETLTDFLLSEMQCLGYVVDELPFICKVWEHRPSSLERSRVSFDIFPGPFSKGFEGEIQSLAYIQTLDDLKTSEISGKMVLLIGEIAGMPLMPKDFPFYYPDEHKEIIDLLEDKRPLAILAATRQHPMCGLSPFPLFEDGNFSIPNAYMEFEPAKELVHLKGPLNLLIKSCTNEASGRQLIASKTMSGRRKIVVFAHMDTKYGTPGAIDNGAGVHALVEIMNLLKDYRGKFDLEFVPFNGEEYFGVSGQLAYLENMDVSFEKIALAINIDGIGHKNGSTHVSFYNINDLNQFEKTMNRFSGINKGPVWYAGDHSIFAFRGVPCLALTSSNLMEDVLQLTHTAYDVPDNLNLSLISDAAAFVAEVVKDF